MAIDERELERLADAKRESRTPLRCPQCGYDLRGAVASQCSECGYRISNREVQAYANEARARIQQAETVKEITSIGLKAGILGAGFLLLGYVLGGDGGGALMLGRVAAFFAGFVGFVMGMNITRFYRVPIEARDDLKNKPDPFVAGGSILVGLALVMLSLFLP